MVAVVGCDPSFGGRDGTGLVAIIDGRVIEAQEVRADFFPLVALACDFAERYRAHLVVDATGTGRPFFEACQDRHKSPVTGVSFGRPETPVKQEGALWKAPSAFIWQAAARMVQDGRVRFAENCEGERLLTEQLTRVMSAKTPSGQDRVTGKQGRKRDDVATAFALACWGLAHPPEREAMPTVEPVPVREVVAGRESRVPAFAGRMWG